MSISIVKSSFFVFLLIIFGKLLSFVRDIFVSKIFGSDFHTDAYFVANNIPSILFAAIISSFLVMVTPIYSKILSDKGKNEADIFISKLINLFLIFTIVLSVISYFNMHILIKVVGTGFDSKTTIEAIRMGKILVLSFPFSSLTLILATVSIIQNKFYALHIIPILSSILTLIGIIYFSDNFGIYSLVWSGLIAFVLQSFIQIYISRNDFAYSFNFKFNDKNIKEILWLVLPIFLGYSVDQINLLVNTNISSGLDEGSLSNLNYAQRLQATIIGTVSTACITVIYPLISKYYAENKIKEFINLIKRGILSVTIILLPLIIFLVLNSKSLVSIVYYRGNFDEKALESTSEIFMYYALSVLLISIREILLRVFYIKNDVKTPLMISLLSLVINIVMSFLLVKSFGVSGLALANLIATFSSFVILYFSFSKKLNLKIDVKKIQLKTFQLLIPTIFLTILIGIQSYYFDIKSNIIIFISLLILNYLIYFMFLLFFKQEETTLVKKILIKKLNI